MGSLCVCMCARTDGFYHSWCRGIIYMMCPEAVHPLWFLFVFLRLSWMYTQQSLLAVWSWVSLCATPLKKPVHNSHSKTKNEAFDETETFNQPIRTYVVTMQSKCQWPARTRLDCMTPMNYTFSVKLWNHTRNCLEEASRKQFSSYVLK